MSSPDAFVDWLLGNLWTILTISGLTGFFSSLAYRYWTGKLTGWSAVRIIAVLLAAWFLSVRIAVMGFLTAAMINGMIRRYRKRQDEPSESPMPADSTKGAAR